MLYLVTPMINSEVMNQTQNEGDTASFTCQATGEPVPTISWYFNGAILVNGMEHMISIMALNTTTINSTLTIMNVQSSDVGTYTCDATNIISTDTSSGVLTVNGKLLLCTYCVYEFSFTQLLLPLLHQWKEKSLISLKEVMDQSHVQLQVILYQQSYGRTVMGVVWVTTD